jgi:ribosomal protein S28E/S33
MFPRTMLALVVAVLVSGCRFFDTQTSPTADLTAEPTPISLSGVVRATGTTAPIKGATVQILDGVNKGRVTTTDVKGAYKFEHLQAGNANVLASAAEMPETTEGIYIDKAATLDFSLEPPPWRARGNGSDAFEVPAWVSRVRIIGEVPAGQCDSLTIRMGGASILNTTLGTCGTVVGIRRYEGVHLMAGGGMAEIFVPSLSVSWTIEWIR